MASSPQRCFYLGDYRRDARNAWLLGVEKGWIVGYFMPGRPRKTFNVEVKYWEYDPGMTGHGEKTLSVFELNVP